MKTVKNTMNARLNDDSVAFICAIDERYGKDPYIDFAVTVDGVGSMSLQIPSGGWGKQVSDALRKAAVDIDQLEQRTGTRPVMLHSVRGDAL